jgi:cyclopropane fatty-acyl-phospholipid synthase-like methyltransferase
MNKNFNNCHDVWNRRHATNGQDLTLSDLIALDNFDAGAGRIEVDNWRQYAKIIAEKANITDGCSVFEMGCGVGAFLYALRELFQIDPSGIDYSNSLIDAAKRAMPDGLFETLEAARIDTNKKYDFVISNGVFHYFDLDYARIMIKKMMAD